MTLYCNNQCGVAGVCVRRCRRSRQASLASRGSSTESGFKRVLRASRDLCRGSLQLYSTNKPQESNGLGVLYCTVTNGVHFQRYISYRLSMFPYTTHRLLQNLHLCQWWSALSKHLCTEAKMVAWQKGGLSESITDAAQLDFRIWAFC